MCWFNSWHTHSLIETDNWVAGKGTDLLVFVSLWDVFTHTNVHLQYLCKTCEKKKMSAKDFWIIFDIWMKYSVSGKNKIWYPFLCVRLGLHYVWKGQNNSYWFLKNPSEFLEVPQHDLKVYVWCAMSAHKIKGFTFLKNVSFDHSIIIHAVIRKENLAHWHYLYKLRCNF
jgi:hypothetical protein